MGAKGPSDDGLRRLPGRNYTDTETSAEKYLKEYPNSPDAAYVAYLQANAYYQQIPDISRDQDVATKAMDAFQEIVKKYPKSEYVGGLRSTKSRCAQDQLAGKEMSIGRFYLNRHNYTAAINRFRNVLQYYQTSRHAPEALYRLVEAYMGLGITDEAQTAAAVLGHNFPDSQWYQDAYALLKGKGLSPQENSSRGSRRSTTRSFRPERGPRPCSRASPSATWF